MVRIRPLPRLPTWIQDVLLALFITVMQIQGTQQASQASEVVSRPLSDFGNLGFALLFVAGASLVVRRRWPIAVFVVNAAISIVYFSIGFTDGPGWLSLFVAIYTVTAHGDGRRSVRVVAVGIAVLAVTWLLAGADVEPRAALGWLFFRIGAAVMAAALGESIRSRQVIATEAQERADRAERTREDEARRRVDAERLRIAREVHDTVAHAIAIINVQAGVTAHVLDKRPERARETLVTIEQTSAQALHEMRAILGVLRDADDGRVPNPGLGQLNELTTMASEGGLDVKLEVSSPSAELSSAVDTAAYRILQEAVTNVVRHVGPARVTIVVGQGPDVLELRVTDDGGLPYASEQVNRTTNRVPAAGSSAARRALSGTGAAGSSAAGDAKEPGSAARSNEEAARPSTSPAAETAAAPVVTGWEAAAPARAGTRGHASALTGAPASTDINGAATTGRGIAGMRERCELLGGHLEAGPRPEGGFEVRATLPFGPAVAAS
jgi:signal transduction histidine kinase